MSARPYQVGEREGERAGGRWADGGGSERAGRQGAPRLQPCAVLS